jgi:F-type H+-transporting ATPase subunit epsilon
MSNIHLEIISAERVVYAEDVDIVIAPGIEGTLAILPSHAPLLTVLSPGELRIVKDGNETTIAVSKGFLEVLDNKIVILADAAERADEIDEQRAQEAMRKAQKELEERPPNMNLESAVADLRRSQARLKVARSKRRVRPQASHPST